MLTAPLRRLGLCLLTCLLFASACSEDSSQAPAAREERNEAASPGPVEAPQPETQAPDPLQVDTEKWNACVDFSNMLHVEMFNAVEMFFEVHGNKERFTPPDGNGQALFADALANQDLVLEPIERVMTLSAIEPRDDLDKACAVLAPLVKDLWTGLVELKDYVDKKTVGEDDMAGGQALYDAVIERYKAMEAALPDFFAALNVKEALVRDRQYQEMTAAGKTAVPAMMRYLAEAEAVQLLFMDKGIDGDNIGSALTPEAFAPYCVAIEEALAALDAVSPEQAVEQGLNAERFAAFVQDAGTLRQTAEGILQRLNSGRDQPAEGGRAAPELYNRQISTLIERYNRAVE